MTDVLWQPTSTQIESSNIRDFQNYLAGLGEKHESWNDLYEWSITKIPDFWQSFADWAEIKFSKPASEILKRHELMRKSRWFCGAQLNFAENLLRHNDENDALVFYVEGKRRKIISYAELHRQVASYQQALHRQGVSKGDRVCGLMPNMPETVYAMLATVSLGAVWSSCSPDFGQQGILDRFGQIGVSILFSVDAYQYKGKRIDCSQLVQSVSRALPTLKATIVIPFAEENKSVQNEVINIKNEDKENIVCKASDIINLCDFLAASDNSLAVRFTQVPFDHPVYIMYSSGTTGLPKCLVQGAGVLLNHVKEHLLHGNLIQKEPIFFYTTCGWMMWNWLVSALFVGARIVLYEGNPMYPGPEVLWQMAASEKIVSFGTSPKYLQALADLQIDFSQFDLSSLAVILSTGAPLAAEQFHYIYKNIKPDLRLSSIAGGTDLNGCFGLGNPVLPVKAGELQCRGLGMAVAVKQDNDEISKVGLGELVCTEPFPSMPLYFWKDKAGNRYKSAYFAENESVWQHGDFVEITENGGMIFLGRSDATLNPGGVRIGTADLYNVLDSVNFIQDCIAIGQPWQNDVRVVLFVDLADGIVLNDEHRSEIAALIRRELTPRHVPALILQVSGIPYTHNGKKVELAVKKTVMGEQIRNAGAIANPELLEQFKSLKELS